MPNALTEDDLRKLIDPNTDSQKQLLENLFREAETTGLNELQSLLIDGFDDYPVQVRDSLERRFESIRAAEMYLTEKGENEFNAKQEYQRLQRLQSLEDKHKKGGEEWKESEQELYDLINDAYFRAEGRVKYHLGQAKRELESKKNNNGEGDSQ